VGLTKLAITRPIFVFMLMALAILGGLIGYRSMRIELNPDVSFGVVTVTTIYPGAGPEEIANQISKKVEDAVSGVNNIQEVTSTSQEGVSVVSITFNIGAPMAEALNDVRTKVDAVIGEFPDNAERPIVGKFDTASSPVMYLAMRSDRLSHRQLRELADRTLKDRLSRIKGVANVSVTGGDVREIQIRLSREAMQRYGVGIVDVQSSIARATLNIPSGRIKEGGEEYTVRLLGEFQSVEQIGKSYISISDGRGSQGESRIVQLKDIATITDANAEKTSASRLDGSESVVMVIQKSREGNAVEISKALTQPDAGPKSLLQQIEDQYGLKFVVTTDSSKQINESISDLNFSLVFGIFLVALVVWVFLHNLRGTIIVGLAIPICLMTTIIALWAMGFTINNMSMLALSLAIGVLVDDAIVVIENIYRHLTMGEEPVEAAINGRSEIGLAAIAITTADVVVFLPIAFMGGIVGQFFRPLALGYAVAVVVSLLVSFTITPMLASRWYKKGEDWEHPKGWFAQTFEKGFHRLADGYARLLGKALKRRWYTFGGGFATLVALFIFITGSCVEVKAPAAASKATTVATQTKATPSEGAPSTGAAAAAAPGPAGPPTTIPEGIGVAANGAMGITKMCIALGVILFIVSVIQKKPKPGLLLSGLAFGLVFPAAAVGGMLYRNLYKKDDVFKFSFAPPSDPGEVNVTLELPPGTAIEETEKVATAIEDQVRDHPEVEYVVTTVGTKSAGFSASDQGTNLAQMTVTLWEKKAIKDSFTPAKAAPPSTPGEKTAHLRTVSSDSVAADLLEEVTGNYPGVKVKINVPSGFAFGDPIQLGLRSDNRELLAQTAVKIRDWLASGVIEGVVTPDISSKPGKPELRAIPDRARMADAGLSASEVGGALRTMYEGDNSTKFRVQGEEYDIRVLLDEADRNDVSSLANAPITFRSGKPIYLQDVARIERGQALDKITRRDRNEEIVVSAGLLPGYVAGTTQAKINAALTEAKLIPEGVTYKPLGEADTQARETGYLFSALFIGLILVYMLLASLYDNLLYPLIIQLAQPQAMVGALLALILTDKTLNIVGFIGIIAMIGLVGKNAILLVDYTNTLRERGEDRTTALIESGRTRLRPIMMTTIALIAGMMPIAMAIGRGSEFRETIGITIIGGVTLSTLLTLLVIPCSYSIFDDASEKLGRLLNRRKTAAMEPILETPSPTDWSEPPAP
jgi:HAE1 family hydrophobic/amphiphilic exporter-1